MHEDLMNEKDLSFLSDACHQLEALYLNQDKMKEVENKYLQALTEKKKAWNFEHTSTLDTVNNLELLYSSQDKMKVLRACSAFYWNTCSLSESKTLSNLALLFSLYI